MAALLRSIRSAAAQLRQPLFWEWLAGIVLLGLLLGTLTWFAVSRYDAFLRLQPLLCSEGLADREFFAVIVAAPVSVLLMLVTLGELWAQLENRRHGRPFHWRYLLGFAGLASGLAALILFLLRC